jgi:hypothetical protein
MFGFVHGENEAEVKAYLLANPKKVAFIQSFVDSLKNQAVSK